MEIKTGEGTIYFGLECITRIGSFSYLGSTVTDFSSCYGAGYSNADFVTLFIDNSVHTSFGNIDRTGE